MSNNLLTMLENMQYTIERQYIFLLCFLLIFISFCFKLGLVPFHQWLPDIYEGTAHHVTVYLATVTKIPILASFIILMASPFLYYSSLIKIPLLIVGCSSMLIGTFGALFQSNLKRILAYSSINHFGLILCVLSSVSIINIQIVIFYVLIYSINMLGIFSALLSTVYLKSKNKNEYLKDTNKNDIISISELTNKFDRNPYLAFCLIVFFLSSAGVPPFGGFFAKFFVIQTLITNGLYLPCIVIIISSLISAFYYIRLAGHCFFTNLPSYSFNKIYAFKPLIESDNKEDTLLLLHKFDSLITYRISRVNSLFVVLMMLLNFYIPYALVNYYLTIIS
jgi:NADH-quinone oxidoreductase subunit N